MLIEEGILVRDADEWVFRSNSPAAQNLHQTLAQRSEARLDSQGVSAWEIASILYLIEAPIEEDQLAQLRDLFQGRTFDWTPFGGSGEVVPVSRETEAYSRQIFEERVVQTRGYFKGGLLKIEAARAIGAHTVPARSS